MACFRGETCQLGRDTPRDARVQRAGDRKEAKGVLFGFSHLELNHDSGS